MQIGYLNFRLRFYLCSLSLCFGYSYDLARFEKNAYCVRYLLYQGVGRLRQIPPIYKVVQRSTTAR